MEFKKLRRWTEKEDEIVMCVFTRIPFSSHYSHRWSDINRALKKHGFTDRTEKAISRRSYRLGLRSHTQTHKEVVDSCKYCGRECMRKLRYKVVVCKQCAQDKQNEYRKSQRGKEYHKQYMRTYRKE